MEGEDIDGMNEGARRVVELARRARTPAETDKRRVRAALAATLGAAAAGVASSTAVASGSTVATVAKGAGAWLVTRALLATALLAGAGVGAYHFVKGARPPAAPVVAPAAPTAPAPAEAPVLAPAPSATPAVDPLLAEVGLLRQAQRALREGSPRRALDLAERHATLYPRSQLALERGALRVFSFCAMGRKAEARALARTLIDENPRSPMRASLEESCGMR